jgi:hypothetical protein
MKLQAKDWAKYKVEDFEVTATTTTMNDATEVKDEVTAVLTDFTIMIKATREFVHEPDDMLGIRYSITDDTTQAAEECISEFKRIIQSKINYGRQLIANEIGPDFEDLVGTETPIHNPHDAFRCKCPMCVEWRNNAR